MSGFATGGLIPPDPDRESEFLAKLRGMPCGLIITADQARALGNAAWFKALNDAKVPDATP